ncbi:MAG: pilus assembly PilX N-terminal domain-containing protein [Nitrospirae bacterium]|nr:pilus assembly PilX N-terminal domain-containing protein [Nitrospirota bacterium]
MKRLKTMSLKTDGLSISKMNNERGFALVITMLFATIALALTGALMFMTLEGSRIAGITQRYSSALEAGKGASDIVINMLNQSANTPDYGSVQSTACLLDKVQKPTICIPTINNPITGIKCTGAVGSDNWLNCTGQKTSSDAKTNPDIISDFCVNAGCAPADPKDYRVYTKIVDTRMTDDLNTGTYVSAYYAVEIISEKKNNPAERSLITFWYRISPL